MLKRSAAIAIVCLWSAGAAAQQQVKGSWTPPKTAWGDPDLSGTWPSTDMVGVPFERPAELGDCQRRARVERGRGSCLMSNAPATREVVRSAVSSVLNGNTELRKRPELRRRLANRMEQVSMAAADLIAHDEALSREIATRPRRSEAFATAQAGDVQRGSATGAVATGSRPRTGSPG